MSVLRVGIVGTGEITRIVHLPVIRNLPAVDIAWAADTSAARLKSIARAFDVPRTVVLSGPPDLPPCDIALLATPVNARRAYLEHFAGRGTAVLTEKPFATSEAEHEEYLRICAGIRVACGYMRRTYAGVRALRRMIHEGWFGELLGIRYTEGGRVGKAGGSSPTLDLDYRSGGGVLRDLGCHGIDTLLDITGAADASVSQADIAWDRTTDRHVAASFMLRGLGGRPGTACPVEFTVSWLEPQTDAIELEFATARIRCGLQPHHEPEIRSVTESGRFVPIAVAVSGARSSYQAFYLEWLDVLDSLRTGAASPFDASGSLLTTRLVDAIYRQGGGA
jgi:predicted dehydrogenase